VDRQVTIGEVRKWNTGVVATHFKIVKNRGFYYGTHYYIIEYLENKIKQTVSFEDLVDKSTLIKAY